MLDKLWKDNDLGAVINKVDRFITTIAQSLFAEAFQSEVVFSHAADRKPILASYGAGPCVIAGGYNFEHRVGFLAHFSHYGEVFQGIPTIVAKLQKLLKKKSAHFDLILRGGIKTNLVSNKIIDAVKGFAAFSVPTLAFRIKSVKMLASDADASASLALDTRDGSIDDYDPLTHNPIHYRKLRTEDIVFAQQSYEVSPQLKVSYLP